MYTVQLAMLYNGNIVFVDFKRNDSRKKTENFLFIELDSSCCFFCSLYSLEHSSSSSFCILKFYFLITARINRNDCSCSYNTQCIHIIFVLIISADVYRVLNKKKNNSSGNEVAKEWLSNIFIIFRNITHTLTHIERSHAQRIKYRFISFICANSIRFSFQKIRIKFHLNTDVRLFK